jgi:hypothetical protein
MISHVFLGIADFDRAFVMRGAKNPGLDAR